MNEVMKNLFGTKFKAIGWPRSLEFIPFKLETINFFN